MKYLTCGTCLLLIASFFPSCKKNSPAAASPSRTELLTSQSWKYESGGIDQDRNGTIDLTFEWTGLLHPCLLDNTATFNANGTGMTDEGATKCNASLPQTSPFTWSFANNETTLNIAGTALLGLGGAFQVQALTSNRLTLAKDSALTAGGFTTTVALIANLKH